MKKTKPNLLFKTKPPRVNLTSSTTTTGDQHLPPVRGPHHRRAGGQAVVQLRRRQLQHPLHRQLHGVPVRRRHVRQRRLRLPLRVGQLAARHHDGPARLPQHLQVRMLNVLFFFI